MKKKLNWIIMGTAFIGMGMGMPSCPGQQAMQQQLDSLQTANSDLTKKVQAQNAQLTTLNNDLAQIKQLLPQITGVISVQKAAMDKLDSDLKDLQKKGGKKKH